MMPNFPEIVLRDSFDDYPSRRKRQQKKKKQPPPKRFKRRELSEIEKKQIEERKKRFEISIKSDDYNDDYQQIRECNEQNLDSILRRGPHSEKVLLCSDGQDQFAYKVVYVNGDGFKAQKGMGVKMRFRSVLFDGSEVHSQFIDSLTDVIGRKRLIPLYDTLALNVTKGQIGTMIATSKFAYGDDGKFPLIPPYATFRVDYQIVDLRKKEFWELGEVQKSDQIEVLFEEMQRTMQRIKNEPNMDPVEKRDLLLYGLYEMRLAEDRLQYSYTPRADNVRKGVCAYEIYFVYYLGQKILALELMDKYFQLQGRNVDTIYVLPREEKYEDELFRIKIQIQLELGLFEEIKADIEMLQNYHPRAFYEKWKQRIEELKKIIEEAQKLSPQQKNNKSIEYDKRRQQLVQEDDKNAPTEYYVYDIRGYRPDDPKNKIQPLPLDKNVDYDKIFQFVIGQENMHIHEKRMKDGWFHKIDWDRSQKYDQDLRLFLVEEEERREEAKMNNQPFEPGFWVYKLKTQTWQQYDARRRQLELEHKYWKVHREYGQKYKDFCIRRKKIQEEQEVEKKHGLGEVSAVQKKLLKKMKKGFKDSELPKMPRTQAYRVFNIE